MEQKSVLGRGLSALIPEKKVEKNESGSLQLPIEKIRRSSYQPRVHFDEVAQNELIESIKKRGVIQPILVRTSDDGYELIAGERRLRAAQAVELETIPAIIREVGNKEAMELALIENVLREDLDPIEEAKGYYRLIKEFGLTQEQIAEEVGKERASIANSMRLLKLPGNVRELISQGLLSVGHGKVLLSVMDEKTIEKLCKSIINSKLSVRETEKLIEKLRTNPVHKRDRKNSDPHLAAIEDELKRKFGTSVKVWQGSKAGKLTIEYYSKEDLNRIIEILGVAF
ncbi:MAG: ParB/RepB/Spo0J family partition protein [Candidatus Ancaeobacter aquaticus]|nr:ParB/RepB/Spo0J family partition protein [Candidatus Ancaeobacter aquaticus]